jgi:hypothetical protein
MRQSVPASDGLIRFVRQVLGCGCPDDLVARTVVESAGDDLVGLDVGGRLLVRLLPSGDLDGLIADFPETVERLVAERDRRGFNRLRMVVVHPEHDAVATTLEAMLELVPSADERIHIHAVPSGSIPPELDGGWSRNPA